MNIIRREIRAHYKGLIGWSVGMLFMVIAGMAKYGAIATGGQQAIQLFKTFPKPVLVIAGINGLDVSTVIGYFGVLYLYILLMATIHAAMIGAEAAMPRKIMPAAMTNPSPQSARRVRRYLSTWWS